MTGRESLDCLAVIRAPIEQYPPSVAQVALLAEAGLKLGVVDCSHADFAPHMFPASHNVERFRLVKHTQLHKDQPPHLLKRLWRNAIFQRSVAQTIRQRQPKVVLAYDYYAMSAVGPLWKATWRPKLIWHFHELCTPENMPSGFLGRRAVRFVCRHAAQVDLVVYSDVARAEAFQREVGLRNVPAVVMNCPRKMESAPKDRLAGKLAGLGLAGCRTVYFHGWIGPSRSLETIIQSMRLWPKDAVFVAVGPASDNYRKTLNSLAVTLGMEDRVIFLGSVPHAEVLQLAASATVGCSLLANQEDQNWTFSAGAINKRFEYMAAGLPQVANCGVGMAEIIETPGCGLLVDPSSPEAVGKAINRILGDEQLRRKMSENSRAIHLSKFNCEHQFAPILEKVLTWCN